MDKAFFSENEAEISLERTTRLKESEMIMLVNRWQSIFDFVLSDPELSLTIKEKDYVFFFCTWAALVLSEYISHIPRLATLSRLEDKLWASFEGQQAHRKVSDYIFSTYHEEELMAICEDAFHPVESDLEGITSKELQDLLLVKFAVIFNTLHSSNSA